ncbi:MAG: dethiobiotin synthase [Chthoniobacterales bacterium]|nr:dethiobiotin synthase [Chthoniobacterales bacterium]
MSLFLTGTDTGVGKTYTAVCLLRLARAAGLRCAGFKPICCGDRRDAELLLAASSEGLSIDEVNPVWLKTPVAPFSAAWIEKVEIQPEQLTAGLAELQQRFDLVLVEGVGGWLVPIKRDYFVADLAKQMALPVVVVALNRLGCLNHVMLTLRSVETSGLRCDGVVLNNANHSADVASATNEKILRKISKFPLLPMLSTDMAEFPIEWHPVVQHHTNATASVG